MCSFDLILSFFSFALIYYFSHHSLWFIPFKLHKKILEAPDRSLTIKVLIFIGYIPTIFLHLTHSVGICLCPLICFRRFLSELHLLPISRVKSSTLSRQEADPCIYSPKNVKDGLRCGGRNRDEIAIDLKSKGLYLYVLVF